MFRSLLIISFLLFSLITQAEFRPELNYYLPESDNYNQEIKTPEEVLGFQVGEFHATPYQIVEYFEYLASVSPRVKLKVIGRTHERKKLIHVYFSSEENIKNLESIREKHIAGDESESLPNITWMGYSIHGNEPSGSNSSMLFGYHLTASNSDDVKAQLNDQVIIIDPMLNPDGLNRFATWANMYRSEDPHSDELTMEHREDWPRGRTNHYWFDLNRDWLLQQHPESQARVRQFHLWRPHILTDFHEMGTNSTYFFQPGVHSRQNPLTDEENFTMTARVSEYHADALDKIGSLYYTQENFDDFYYGKGSTYPDIHGGIGILFEQASSRGHKQTNDFGEISFPFTIKNQLTTSLSTVKAVQENRQKFKDLRNSFENKTRRMIAQDKTKAIVFSSVDQYRIDEVLRILSAHQIKFYPLSRSLSLNKNNFNPSNSYIIPMEQPQYRLIKSLFESRKKFKDNVFYDVSAWNFAYSFDLNFAFVDGFKYNASLIGKIKEEEKTTSIAKTDAIALAFDWNNFQSARLLSEFHKKGLVVQGLTKDSKLITSKGEKSLTLGSLILPLNSQDIKRAELLNWLDTLLPELKVKPIEIKSGLSVSGVDMGSPAAPVIKPIKPLLLVGDGVSSYDAGEVWHLFDQRLSHPLSMMTQGQFARLTTIPYTHVIMVNGQYSFDEQTTEKIQQWLMDGGIIIAHSQATNWALSNQWTSSQIKPFATDLNTDISYSEKSQIDAKHVIGGAIVEGRIDTSHPLGFGLDDGQLPIFKRGQQIFTKPLEPFVAIANLTDQPHMAGYISEDNVQHLKNGSSIIVQGIGRGKIIAFSDNPVFRGFWLGTTKVFVNALFYGDAISSPQKTQLPQN